MATMTIGKLVVDLDRVSDEAAEALRGFEQDAEMTDDVIAALAEWSRLTKNETADGESKASRIRRMAAAGMSTGDISRALDVRFQFVYNVLNKPAKKA